MRENKKCAQCACFILMILLIIGFILLSVYLGKLGGLLDPTIPLQKVAVINANLSRFELTGSPATSLFYNLTFTMSIQNSASDGDAYYKHVAIDCYHNAEPFDLVTVEDFSIEQGSTLLLNLTTSGNSTVSMEGDGSDVPRESSASRVFDMEIWLKGERVVVDDDGGYATDLSYQCKLSLPLLTSNTNSTHHKFKHVECIDKTLIY